jgi:MinD-like ATPase involved in chromosome partitioning or flagellar assembly
MNGHSVTLFDPNETQLNTLAYEFEKLGIHVNTASSYSQMVKAEVYILDIHFDIVNIKRLAETGAPVAVMVDTMNMDDWQECIRLGIKYFKRPVTATLIIDQFSHLFGPTEVAAGAQTVVKKKEEKPDPLAFMSQQETQPKPKQPEFVADDFDTEPELSSKKQKRILRTNPITDEQSFLPKGKSKGTGNRKAHLPKVRTQTFRQMTVGLYAPKGGVGKTVIAMNLAAACASHSRVERCCLIDLDRQFGNVIHTLGIDTNANIADFSRNISPDSSWQEVEENLYEHHTEGFYILPAPKDLLHAEGLTPEDIAKTLQVLKKHFDVVIIDLSPNIDQLTLEVFQNVDATFLVSTTDLPTNNSLTDFLGMYEKQLHLDSSKLHLVLNRYVKKTGITPKSIQAAFPGIPLIASMKEDINVQLSVNKRSILTLRNPKSDFATNIYSMMEHMHLFQEDNNDARSGFLSRLRRKREEVGV